MGIFGVFGSIESIWEACLYANLSFPFEIFPVINKNPGNFVYMPKMNWFLC